MPNICRVWALIYVPTPLCSSSEDWRHCALAKARLSLRCSHMRQVPKSRTGSLCTVFKVLLLFRANVTMRESVSFGTCERRWPWSTLRIRAWLIRVFLKYTRAYKVHILWKLSLYEVIISFDGLMRASAVRISKTVHFGTVQGIYFYDVLFLSKYKVYPQRTSLCKHATLLYNTFSVVYQRATCSIHMKILGSWFQFVRYAKSNDGFD